MKFILGQKLAMSQVFAPDGKVIPVTKVKAGPCLIVQKKNIDQDGYSAIKCAMTKKKTVNKSLLGLFRKFGDNNYQYIKEFRIKSDDPVNDKVKIGDQITVDIFAVGDQVSVVGLCKGKGFQGVVKRHGFKGGKKSHGHKDQLRMPGSIGATGPARVFKGKKMAGRTGGQQVTVTGLEIIEIEPENNILYIKGAIPGARNTLLMVKGEGDFELLAPVKQEKPAEEKKYSLSQKSEKSQAPKDKFEAIESKTEEPKTKQPEMKTKEQVKEPEDKK